MGADAVFQQIGHGIGSAGPLVFEAFANLGVVADDPCRPGLMTQAKHFFPRMAEGAMT
jgi:hypothetical protein